MLSWSDSDAYKIIVRDYKLPKELLVLKALSKYQLFNLQDMWKWQSRESVEKSSLLVTQIVSLYLCSSAFAYWKKKALKKHIISKCSKNSVQNLA